MCNNEVLTQNPTCHDLCVSCCASPWSHSFTNALVLTHNKPHTAKEQCLQQLAPASGGQCVLWISVFFVHTSLASIQAQRLVTSFFPPLSFLSTCLLHGNISALHYIRPFAFQSCCLIGCSGFHLKTAKHSLEKTIKHFCPISAHFCFHL